MLNRVLVRWYAPLLLVAVVALLSGCPKSAELSTGGDDDNAPDSPGNSYCGSDEDCIPIGVACCDCPTFAVSHNDALAAACDIVTCPPRDPMSACADNLVAKCQLDVNKCELRCKEVTCDSTSCGAAGFNVDGNGCLTCACAAEQPPENGCAVDTDCVRVNADCCGCELGGFDTAVPRSQEGKHLSDLMCPQMPSCPGIDQCANFGAPRCIQNQCTLLDPGPLPPGACGRNDLPPCGTGFACVLNANDSASLHGVGVCTPQDE